MEGIVGIGALLAGLMLLSFFFWIVYSYKGFYDHEKWVAIYMAIVTLIFGIGLTYWGLKLLGV